MVNLKNIIKGHFNRLFSRNNEVSNKRLDICRDCSNRENTIIGDICGICGCPLDAKTRVDDEKCDMNKW